MSYFTIFSRKINKEKLIVFIKVIGTFLAILLFLLFINSNWSEFKYNVSLIGLNHVLILLLLTLISRIFVSLRWYYLIKVLEPKIGLLNVIKITFSGLFASNFLPTTIGGDLIRVAGGIRYGHDPINITTSLLLDRAVGMLGMVVALPMNLASPYFNNLISENNPIINNYLYSFTPFFKPIINQIIRIFGKVRETIILWKNHPQTVFISLIFTFSHMGVLFITLWGLFRFQNIQISFITVAGLWSLSYFFTLIPISVNGLGLQEVSITYLYSSIGGAPLESCLVTAVMIRILQSLASVPGVFYLSSFLDKNGNNERKA